MKWRESRRSTNVQSRGGPGGLAIGGGAGLIITVIALLLGVNPGEILNQGPATDGQAPPLAENDTMVQFVEHILGDTEDTWNAIFTKMGREYVEPKLNIFSGSVSSACGVAGEAVGPFYCARDQQVYIDLSFYEDLRTRFGAPGDVAQAYVIAHEVGHHVQNLMGLADQVANAQQGASGATANRLSVRMELQADCFAGIWANNADRQRHLLEIGEVKEALGAAAAIGDDRLQQESQGRVSPESFTHGSSEQRVRWFNRGYETGDVKQCDTFGQGVVL
ncbi:MAG: neutral zinc metallopeptidase [Longimicrobiales bacterium]